MALLPSGRRFCVTSDPLRELLRSFKQNGLRIPELLSISQVSDLKGYLRFMWLLPIGADTRPETYFHRLAQPSPEGLTMVHSGGTLASPPDELDAEDVIAVEEFWLSDRCQAFAHECMQDVRKFQKCFSTSKAPEDHLLVKWFQGHLPQPQLRAA